jgi:uncharacterized membrane protein (DUF485 family)
LPEKEGKFKIEFPVKRMKIKPWQITIIVLYFSFLYFLVDFMKNTLEAKLENDSLITLVIIMAVILLIGAVTLYMVRKLAEKEKR